MVLPFLLTAWPPKPKPFFRWAFPESFTNSLVGTLGYIFNLFSKTIASKPGVRSAAVEDNVSQYQQIAPA